MTEDMKLEPLSDRISLGIYSLVIMDINAVAVFSCNSSKRNCFGISRTEVDICQHKLNSFFLVIGRGPTISIATLSKG